MKARKIILLTILCAIPVLTIVFRASLYNGFVHYNLKTMTTIAPLENEESMSKVDSRIQDLTEVSAIAEQCLDIATEQLDVALEVLPADPNLVAEQSTANPMGMSAYLASLCNYALAQKQLDAQWQAHTSKCDIHVMGIDLAKMIKNENYKGHDLVVIENKESGERIQLDPIASEYFRINQVGL